MGIRILDVVPDCSAVSQLQSITKDEVIDNNLSDTLFLISQPNPRTHTGYISKNIGYDMMSEALSDTLKLYGIHMDIRDISSCVHSRDAFFEFIKDKHRWLSAETTPSPYIISSFYQISGVIVSADGYRLRDGMQIEFNNTVFNHIRATDISSTTLSALSGNISNLTSDTMTTNALCATNVYLSGESIENMCGKVYLVDWT